MKGWMNEGWFSNKFHHQLAQELKEFVEIVNNKLNIEAVFIVGSFADGTNNEASDLDIIVVSSDFNYYCLNTRRKILSGLIKKSSVKIDLYCYTTQEYISMCNDEIWKNKARVEVWKNEHEKDTSGIIK